MQAVIFVICAIIVIKLVMKYGSRSIRNDGCGENSISEMGVQYGCSIDKVQLEELDKSNSQTSVDFLKSNLSTPQLHELLKLPEQELADKISKVAKSTVWSSSFSAAIDNESRALAAIVHTKLFPKDNNVG